MKCPEKQPESADTNIFIISVHCCDILNNWMYRLKPLSRSSDRREISARKRIFSTFKATPKGEYPLCVYLDWSHYVLLKKSGLRATAVLLLWSTFRLDCCCQTSTRRSGVPPYFGSVGVFGLTQSIIFTHWGVWFLMMQFRSVETVSVKRCSMCTSERGQGLF